MHLMSMRHPDRQTGCKTLQRERIKDSCMTPQDHTGGSVLVHPTRQPDTWQLRVGCGVCVCGNGHVLTLPQLEWRCLAAHLTSQTGNGSHAVINTWKTSNPMNYFHLCPLENSFASPFRLHSSPYQLKTFLHQPCPGCKSLHCAALAWFFQGVI